MDKVWNRKENKLESIRAYKAEALLFIHKNPVAAFFMSKIATIPFFSTLMALKDYTSFSRKKVINFVKENNLDESEFEKPAIDYSSFSEFFDRRLKPSARPVNKEAGTLVSPSDGILTVFPDIKENATFTVKGRVFSVESLLGDRKLAEEYSGGSLAIVYLAPTDYHRYHYPCDCSLEKIWTIGNRLFSVNPIAMEYGFRPFDVNVRDISILNNDKSGRFLMIEVGATYVGRMVRTNAQPGTKNKGDEKGYFGLGGSTIILIFKKGAVSFDKDILEWTEKSVSSKVKMGEKIGSFCL